MTQITHCELGTNTLFQIFTVYSFETSPENHKTVKTFLFSLCLIFYFQTYMIFEMILFVQTLSLFFEQHLKIKQTKNKLKKQTKF